MTGLSFSVRKWLLAAMRRDVVKRSTVIALVVGSILVVINQGDALLSGQPPAELMWKIPLTFLVPYCVSTFAAVQTIVSSENGSTSS